MFFFLLLLFPGVFPIPLYIYPRVFNFLRLLKNHSHLSTHFHLLILTQFSLHLIFYLFIFISPLPFSIVAPPNGIFRLSCIFFFHPIAFLEKFKMDIIEKWWSWFFSMDAKFLIKIDSSCMKQLICHTFASISFFFFASISIRAEVIIVIPDMYQFSV